LNSGLATFAFLMIVLGAVASFYPVSILGVFLLIAALLVPSRKLPPRPQQTSRETRRVAAPHPAHIPSTARRPETEFLPQTQTRPTQFAPAASPAQPTTATPVLFPTTMFPFINPVTPVQQSLEQKPQQEEESKDEILELAAIAIFLKLLSR